MLKRKISILMVGTCLSGFAFGGNSTFLFEKPTESMPVYMGGLFEDIGILKKGQEYLENGQKKILEQITKDRAETHALIKETKDEMHTLIKETKDEMHTLVQLFNRTHQDTQQKFEERYQNLTSVTSEIRSTFNQTQSANEIRLKQLESHWSAYFYDDVMKNPQFYLGLLTLGLGAKINAALPLVAPYGSWLSYGASGVSFIQVFWNLFKATTHEDSMVNVLGTISLAVGSLIFTVHKNEARIAPHITANRLVVALGLMAGASSYWKEAYNLALGWIKS